MLATSKVRFAIVASRRERAVSITLGEGSMPIASPGATRLARPAVIEPGPQPTSSSRWPGRSSARKKAASFSAVRLAWLLTTEARGPCWWTSWAGGELAIDTPNSGPGAALWPDLSNSYAAIAPTPVERTAMTHARITLVASLLALVTPAAAGTAVQEQANKAAVLEFYDKA